MSESYIDRIDHIYIQENWVEEFEGDILIRQGPPYTIVSAEQIKNMTYDPKILLVGDRDCIEPILGDRTDTYDSIFSGLYGNKKTKTTFGYIKNPSNGIVFPKFIKPVNTKIFDGMVIDNYSDLFWFDFPDDTEIYMADVVSLMEEHRIFITRDNRWIGNTPDGVDEFKSIILDRVHHVDKTFAIDIAFCITYNKWIIVENNPTFSLSFYNYDCVSKSEYFDFVVESWILFGNRQKPVFLPTECVFW